MSASTIDPTAAAARTHHRRGLVLGCCILAAFALSLLTAGRAEAACFYSAPTSANFPDSPFDGELGIAPEITGVGATLDGACNAAVNPAIDYAPSPGGLVYGDSVATYVNTDGNPATGDPVFGGADKVVMVLGFSGPDSGPAMAGWNGYTFDFAGAPILPAVGGAGFAASLDQLGVPAPTTLGLEVGALYEGLYDYYFDFAPEPGSAPFGFPVSFSTSPPPPPVPQPVTQQAPASTPKKKAKKKKKCKKGYKLRKVRGKKVCKKRKRKKARAVSAAATRRYEALDRKLRAQELRKRR